MTAIIARRIFSRLVLMPLVLSFALGLVGTAGPAGAGVPIYIDFEGIAIQGYDPVAYFTEGRPMKGSEQYTYKWVGATWHFANAKHRDLFTANPIKYAPQYGGFVPALRTVAIFPQLTQRSGALSTASFTYSARNRHCGDSATIA